LTLIIFVFVGVGADVAFAQTIAQRSEGADRQGTKSPSISSPTLDPRTIATVDRALFRIETARGRGSGFQYLHPGYVLTNRHVVEGIRIGQTVDLRPVHAKADGSDGLGEAIPGTVRYKHPHLDVAVIEVEAPAATVALRPVEARGVKYLPRGSELLAHGFPGIGTDSRPTVSRGMLSAHYDDPLTQQTFYITDTSLSPGSSGGPVTDANGGVIGIATAVSIVVDGAGSSWGYVLPISCIEDALHCSSGTAGLPKPFDPGRHAAAIRSAPGPLHALEALRLGSIAAVEECAGAGELASAMDTLLTALSSTKGTIDGKDVAELAKGMFGCIQAPLERLVEQTVLQEDPEELKQLAMVLLQDSRMSDWSSAIIRALNQGLPPQDGLIASAEHLQAIAKLVVGLLESSASHCEDLQAAFNGQTEGPGIDRAAVQRFATSVVPLVQARMMLNDANLSDLDISSEHIPARARQTLRLCKAELENAQEQWTELPPPCRLAAELTLRAYSASQRSNGDAANTGAPKSERTNRTVQAFGGDVPGAGVKPDDGKTIETYSELAKSEGWKQWGPSQKARTSGPIHNFSINFDESTGIVMIVAVSKEAKDIASGTLNDVNDGVFVLSERMEDYFSMQTILVRRNQNIRLGVVSRTQEDYEVEFAVFYRTSTFEAMLDGASAMHAQHQLIATRMTIIPPNESYEYVLDTVDWKHFAYFAREMNGRDVDIEVIGPDGSVIERDAEADATPIVAVANAVRGKHVVRLRNTSDLPAWIESAAFAVPRG